MYRKHWKKSRRGVAVPQTTPSFQTLSERYNAGLHSRKEITRRVKDANPKALSDEEKSAWVFLRQVGQTNEWFTADEVPMPVTKSEK